MLRRGHTPSPHPGPAALRHPAACRASAGGDNEAYIHVYRHGKPSPHPQRYCPDHGMETRPGSTSLTVPRGMTLKSPQGTQGACVPRATLPTRCTSNRPLRGNYTCSRYRPCWKGLDFVLTRYGAPLYDYQGPLRPGGTMRNHRPSQQSVYLVNCFRPHAGPRFQPFDNDGWNAWTESVQWYHSTWVNTA